MFQRTLRKLARMPAIACLPIMLGLSGNAGAVELSADAFKLYGDFRGRLEYDWDSRRGNGSERDDRGRLRVRVRLGLDFTPDENIKVGVRLRSGSDDSQQSPHITVLDFNDNSTGDADFNFDKWYFQYTAGGTKTWLGRNSLPWWHQDELVFDDEITPAGLGFTYKTKVLANSALTVNTGVFTLPEGMQDFRGDLLLAQVVWDIKISDIDYTFAGGYLGIDADPLGPGETTILLQGNQDRDYSTFVGNVQVRMDTGGKPLTVGADFMQNTEGYSSAPPGSFTEFHKNHDTGWTVLGTWGDTREAGNWLVGYYYTYIEMLALNNSYSQDDWVRWGSASQTRATNMKGSEFRGAYAIRKNMNVVARLYIVEAIDKTNPGDARKEDGNRFRLDFNYKF